MQCRACLKIDCENTAPLDEYYVMCFNLITNLNIHLGDNKPQQLCEDCLRDLIFSISFREKCITSDSKLIETDVTFEESNNFKVIKEEEIQIDFEIECDVEKIAIKGESISKTEPDDNDDDMTYENNFEYEYTEDTKVTSNIEKKPIKRKRKKVKSKMKKEKNKPISNYDCGLCMEKCEKDKLYAHVESHKSSNKCLICSKEFKEWSMLSLHRVSHLPTRRLFCHICFKYVKQAASLEVHYNLKHFDKNPKSVLQCQDCYKTYATLRGLQKHRWAVHSGNTFACDVCEKEFMCKKTLAYHIKTNHCPKQTYYCNECDYTCSFPGNLKQHIICKHTPDRVYCKQCKASFENQSKYQKHKCNGRRPIVCPVCGIVLSRHMRLNRHLVMHSTERKYKCSRCPATYKSKTALETHLNKHDGVKTRHCERCPASFYELSALVRHRRTHTGEKPYICKTCLKGFGSSHNLKVHMQVHGEFVIKKRSMESSCENVGEIFKTVKK